MKTTRNLILLVCSLFFLGACDVDPDTKAAYSKQCEKQAIAYVQEKYAFTAQVESVKLDYVDHSPIPNPVKELSGKAIVTMRYQGKTFQVYTSTHPKDEFGADDYQLSNLTDAFLKELQGPLQSPLNISHLLFLYDVEDHQEYIPSNMFPKNFQFEKGKLYDALKQLQVRGVFYTDNETTLAQLKQSKLFQENVCLGIFNFKLGANHPLTDRDVYSYSNHIDSAYRDMQLVYAKDLKDSVLIQNGNFYYTVYTPYKQGNILSYVFDKHGVLSKDAPIISTGICDRSLFQNVEKNYKVLNYSDALTIDTTAFHTVVYIPTQQLPKPLTKSQEDSDIALVESFLINERTGRTSAKRNSDHDIKITTEGEYTKFIPDYTSTTLCYAELIDN